jgi:acylphosphatase
MSKARVHVVITGKVQGVYFRDSAQREADALGVTGWIRNNSDGSVEGVFEGTTKNLFKMIEWCQHGPPRAHVIDIKENWQNYQGEFKSFGIAGRGLFDL